VQIITATQPGESRPVSCPRPTMASESVRVCVDYFLSFILLPLSYGLRASLSEGGGNVTAQVKIDGLFVSGASLSNVM